jgi:hypothetical protein
VAESYRASRNVLTPHAPADYPGLTVVVPGPGWEIAVICPRDAESFVARGGERVYAYETPGGGRADGFLLRAGDRATLGTARLPHGLWEWRVERA